MIDRRPAVIARPSQTEGVRQAVRFARKQGLLVSIKGGGHAPSGHAVAGGGLMIDLALMKGIRVDPDARTALAEAGVNWGEFDQATQAHGLAVTGGRVPGTGISGLTLGSGSGWLERKLGYTVDNVLGMEMVTADGEVVWASATENPELFWGLRGGGGNFGVVTKFEYRLHQIGPIIFGGMIAFPNERAAEVLRAYRTFIEDAPDDIGGAAALLTAPPEPFVPEGFQGKPAIAIVALYTGEPQDGPQAFKPILGLGPALAMVAPMPYVALQSLLVNANPPGLQNYWKAYMYPQLPDAAIDALAAATKDPISPNTTIIVQPIGGAVHRVPEDASAMGWRSAKWALPILGMWQDPADNEQNIARVRNVANALAPWAQKGTYLNYLMDEGDRRVQESFGPHYQRMVALKNQWDPDNFFRLNQNIKPAV
jgi:FAD/FMN-containing dehydrogenase